MLMRIHIDMKHMNALKVERIYQTCSTSIAMFTRIHMDIHMNALNVARIFQTSSIWISNHKTTLNEERNEVQHSHARENPHGY